MKKALKLSTGVIIAPINVGRNESILTEGVENLSSGIYQIPAGVEKVVVANPNQERHTYRDVLVRYELITEFDDDDESLPQVVATQKELDALAADYIGISNLYRAVTERVEEPVEVSQTVISITDFDIVSVDDAELPAYDPAWNVEAEYIGMPQITHALFPGRLQSVESEAVRILESQKGISSVRAHNYRGELAISGTLRIEFADKRFTMDKPMFGRSRKLVKNQRYERFDFTVQLPASIPAASQVEGYAALDTLLDKALDFVVKPEHACDHCDGRGYLVNSKLRLNRS